MERASGARWGGRATETSSRAQPRPDSRRRISPARGTWTVLRRPAQGRRRAVASAPVDPDRTPEADLDAIAADLAGVETALDQLEDGTYVSDEPTEPEPA